ncbi:MAG: hypothetical protein HC859_03515 [Bacteroidia bacterium]|nr:hypothetical protein [Bacteroidia bacterium]
MKEFYKTPTAHIYFDDALDTLFLEYNGRVANHAQFVEINTAVLKAFQSLNTQKFVADIRKMGIISIESQQWVVKNLLPGMIAHLNGRMLYHAQFLDPSEIMAKVSGSNIKNQSATVAQGFEVVQVSDVESLKKYLMQAGK